MPHILFNLTNVSLTIFLLFAPTIYLLIIFNLYKEELKRSLPQLFLFLTLTAVFLNKLIFKTQTLAQKDFNNIQIPLFHFFKTSISNFQPPIWDARFCGGFDAFASPLAGYFSTFNWVFILFENVYRGFNFYIFAQIFLCLLFAYLMLRTYSFSKGSSFFGAILFTFNGFVAMRLSPGVGVEYLFAYKWLPLILAFTKRYLDNPKNSNFIGLSIAFALSLEGNTNLVISIGILWLILLSFNYKEVIRDRFKILAAPLIAICIYALKVLPVIGLFNTGVDRFTNNVGSWRGSNYDLYMYPEIFFPLKSDFTNGVFTPGLIGLAFFTLGLLLLIIDYVKNNRLKYKVLHFALFTFIIAFFITIENPIYYFFYSFPVLNKVTIVPAFTIFYLVPIVFLGTYAYSRLSDRHNLLALFLPIASLLVFLEVLLGPSLMGERSYTFNFAKMDYSGEPYDFPHYNLLLDQEPGTFLILDEPHIFLYPYAIAQLDLQTLNSNNYFFGCRDDTDLRMSSLSQIKTQVSYLMSMNSIDDPDLELLGVVSLSNILDHKSHSVFERKMDYYRLYETGWNDDIYVYRVLCKENCPANRLPLDNVPAYVNPYIYIGYAISLVTFIAISYHFWRKK